MRDGGIWGRGGIRGALLAVTLRRAGGPIQAAALPGQYTYTVSHIIQPRDVGVPVCWPVPLPSRTVRPLTCSACC